MRIQYGYLGERPSVVFVLFGFIDSGTKTSDCYCTAITHFSQCICEQYLKHYQYKKK